MAYNIQHMYTNILYYTTSTYVIFRNVLSLKSHLTQIKNKKIQKSLSLNSTYTI